jgi:energy-coupling factor transporter ATP-binding protein EcfA2
MTLSFDFANNKATPNVVFCPQDAEMWPKEMAVRDVLFFACSLFGTSPADFQDSFQGLGLTPLYDRPFGALSGGQKQRVNVATCIVRSAPALILLDEPLGSLDEENAIAALNVLKDLPVKHSFIMTAHQSRGLSHHFDRILQFDAENGVLRSDHSPMLLSLEDEEAVAPLQSSTERVASFATLKAMLILWHGQFYARPYLELAMVFLSVGSGVLTGFIGRPSLTETPVVTVHSLRTPIYGAFMPFGITFLTSLCVSVVYATREQPLVNNFNPQRALNSLEFLSVTLFRASFYGLLQSAAWTFSLLPVLTMWGDYVDIVLCTPGRGGLRPTSQIFLYPRLVPW